MTFAKNEAGAVTVDWVVLTAALVGLGIATMSVVSSGVEDISGDVDNQLSGTQIFTSFDSANFSAFYNANMAMYEATGYEYWQDGGATFQSALDEVQNGSDALVQEFIDDELEGQSDEIARLAVLDGLDPATTSVEDYAAAIGTTTENLQNNLANPQFGNDLTAFHDHSRAYTVYTIEYNNMLMDVADERGIDYSEYHVR